MGRLLKIAGLLLLATVVVVGIAAGLALLLSFEKEPRFQATSPPAPEEIARLKRTLKRQDPRRLEPGTTGKLSLSDRELALALRQCLAMLGSSEAVLVDVEPGRLALRASVELPRDLSRRFLNVDMVVIETERLPRFERLQIGGTRVPARLADRAWRWVLTDWLKERGGADVLEMVQAVALGEDRVDVDYRWQPWTVELVRAGLVGDADGRRLEAYSNELAALTRELSSRRAPLVDLLGPLFDLARRRSRGGNPMAENRAAIVVLGIWVNRRQLDTLVPEAVEWERPRWIETTLRGQYDLAQHFMISALVAAVGGGTLSDALGLEKELADSRGGSGFSFRDLAADRAGTRFGELAVGSRASARRIQRLLEEDASEALLLPRVEDLPDSLSQAEFQRLVDEVGSPRFQELTAEIERRIGASRLFQDDP